MKINFAEKSSEKKIIKKSLNRKALKLFRDRMKRWPKEKDLKKKKEIQWQD